MNDNTNTTLFLSQNSALRLSKNFSFLIASLIYYLRQPQVLDKVRARPIMSFVRSRSVNYLQNTTTQFFSIHNTHIRRNVCITYDDARCRYRNCTPVCNSDLEFASQTRKTCGFPASLPGYTGQTPRRRSLAFYRFHTPFPYIHVRAGMDKRLILEE